MHSPYSRLYMDPTFQKIILDAEAKGYVVSEVDFRLDGYIGILFLPEGDWRKDALLFSSKDSVWCEAKYVTDLEERWKLSTILGVYAVKHLNEIGCIEIAFRASKESYVYTLMHFGGGKDESTYAVTDLRRLYCDLCSDLNLTTMQNYPAPDISHVRDACFLLESILKDPTRLEHEKDYVLNFINEGRL